MSARTRIAVLSVAAAIVGAAAVVSPAPAVATAPPISVLAAPRPADSTTSIYQSPGLRDLSCGAAGSCVAVGFYVGNADGLSHPLIETYASGSWHPSRAPLPSGAASGGERLTNVSCSGAGLCAALGTYEDGITQFVDTWYGGQWSSMLLPAPADVDAVNYHTASSIACQAPSTCYAVGNYNGHYAFIVTMTVGVSGPNWTALAAPTPAFPPFYAGVGTVSLLSVSCTGSGGCWAAGKYTTYSGDMVDPGGTPCDCGNTDDQGLLMSLIPGQSANANWAPPISGAQNSAWQGQFFGIGCGHGACVANGQFLNYPTVGAVGTWVDTYTGAFTPTKAAVPADAKSTVDPSLRAGSCGTSQSCVDVGNYVTTTNVSTPLIVVGGAAIAAPAPTGGFGQAESLGAVSCFSATTCLAASVSQPGSPTPDNTLEILSGTTWTAARAPALPDSGLTAASGYIAVSCDAEQHCFAITSGYTVPDGAEIVEVGAAPTPPSVALTGTWSAFTLASSIKATWHGSPGSAAIAHYTVQVRRAPWNGGFGAWATPSGWGALSASTTSVSVPLPVGDNTCVRVEATDTMSHTSAWTAARCIARPVDDRALTASANWARDNASGYYLGTFTVTSHLSTTLTLSGAQFDRLGLVATRCPTCGKVAVYSGTTLLSTLNLYAATTAHEVVFAMAKVSQRTTKITLKVVTSGKSVQIDGLGISRT